MLEGNVGTKNLCYKHNGLLRDSTAAVLLTQMGARKKSSATGRLLIVLVLRQQVARASPLVATHVAGDLHVFGDIPSRSFGYSK